MQKGLEQRFADMPTTPFIAQPKTKVFYLQGNVLPIIIASIGTRTQNTGNALLSQTSRAGCRQHIVADGQLAARPYILQGFVYDALLVGQGAARAIKINFGKGNITYLGQKLLPERLQDTFF